MNIDKQSQITREKIVLAVYCLYTIAMTGVVFLFQWDSWIVPVILIGMVVCMVMSFTKYRNYEFRAFVTTAMMWMNFSIYLMNSDDFTGAFSTMSAMIILLAIYCIPNLTNIGVAVYTLHLIYHFLFVHDLNVDLSQEGIQCILRIASVYVAQYVTYNLMKTQVESNAVMLDNIEAVRSAEQSKDDFMANMSHEIRTPINTVCGISEMVLREDLPEEAREGVYDIQTAGRQLLSLVSDILDFSELSSGKMEIVPDTYNITSTVNDILNMAVAKAAGKNIELIVDCDARIPRGLVGDEQKIRRAVMNVLDNAIKFTEEGGILLSFTFREESYGGNLIVTVKDTGIGMKEEMLETLFNSFSQVDSKRNRRASGMGLGLSIAKVIVNRMGGFILVRSVYGEGTEVQMVFPQKVNNAEPVATVKDAKESRVMQYLDVEKYQNALVRDGYARSIRHMVEQLGVYYRHSKSLAELKRWMERDHFNYVFVSWKEYCEDRQYFEKLSKQLNVVLVLEREHKESIMGSRLLCVYKPFYVLTIASVLNGQYVEHIGRNVGNGIRFIAPEARVLVVDDNLMNLKVVEGLLRPYKIKVFVAESGKEALKKIETERFDIVFMDHMMPEMDGIETFHRIRQKPGNYYQSVPIVALTANAIGGAREMFLQEGFAEYVSKPIEISALERVLYKFIPDSKIIREFDEEPNRLGTDKRGNANVPKKDKSKTEEKNVSAKEQTDTAAKEQPVGITAQTPQEDGLHLEGIDIGLGIRYCGGQLEDYIEIVRTYYGIGVTQIEDIRKKYEAGDWKNYTTLVHAVKSTSLGIGAVQLSEMAKALEAAGKESDTAYITEHTQEMLKEYERVLSVIGAEKQIVSEVAEEEEPAVENLSEISKEELLAKLEQISGQMESFDSDAVLEGLEELYAFRYQDEPVKKLLSAVQSMADDFDFIGAKEETDKLMESVRG